MSVPLMQLPITESYWVIPGRFLAGEYPGHPQQFRSRERISRFLDAGFNTFLDLTIPGELEPYDQMLLEIAMTKEIPRVIHQRFPIGDYGLPGKTTMDKILDAIVSSLDENRKVYLHCWGGIGRTGTAVGCYLVSQGLSGEQALQQLAEWWRTVPKRSTHPRSPETEAQVRFIMNWKA